jgi:hypothetical protein
MKWVVVEPVPSPNVIPFVTNFNASSAARRLRFIHNHWIDGKKRLGKELSSFTINWDKCEMHSSCSWLLRLEILNVKEFTMIPVAYFKITCIMFITIIINRLLTSVDGVVNGFWDTLE